MIIRIAMDARILIEDHVVIMIVIVVASVVVYAVEGSEKVGVKERHRRRDTDCHVSSIVADDAAYLAVL